MPWNEPGRNGNNQQDPWGGKRDQNPPDLDKLIGEFIRKIRAFFGKTSSNKNTWEPAGKKELGIGAGFVFLAIFILWLLVGFYIVNPAEEAVLLRFGRFSEIAQPGLHWMARFIDTKFLVDVQKIYSFSLERDFLTKSSEQSDLPIPLETDKKTAESHDQSKNLVNVELNVQYRITNPRAYLFNVVNPDETMQGVATVALSDVIGRMKLDEVLTTGRELLSANTEAKMKKILTSYNAGLDVVAVTLKKVQAPDQVREAFSDVNRADQDKATTIQQAQAYASKVVPVAQGNAARILADANGYRQQVVLTAQANVARYQAMLQAYQASPDITRERLYLDAMQAILQHTSKILIDANSNTNMLYLPLDKILHNVAKASTEEGVNS